MVVFGNHFFEGLLRLVCIGCSSEFVSMMDAADDEFFIHSYRKDGVAFLEFFVPTVIGVVVGERSSGVVVGEYELFSHAVAASKNDRAVFPVYAWVVALEPVVSKVDVLFSKVRDC